MILKICCTKLGKIFEMYEAVSQFKDNELSFPRKWESILFYGFWIPVFKGMTQKK